MRGNWFCCCGLCGVGVQLCEIPARCSCGRRVWSSRSEDVYPVSMVNPQDERQTDETTPNKRRSVP